MYVNERCMTDGKKNKLSKSNYEKMKILFKNYFTISAEFYEDSDIKMDNSMFCTILKNEGFLGILHIYCRKLFLASFI